MIISIDNAWIEAALVVWGLSAVINVALEARVTYWSWRLKQGKVREEILDGLLRRTESPDHGHND